MWGLQLGIRFCGSKFKVQCKGRDVFKCNIRLSIAVKYRVAMEHEQMQMSQDGL
jgi:hypothetical protein